MKIKRLFSCLLAMLLAFSFPSCNKAMMEELAQFTNDIDALKKKDADLQSQIDNINTEVSNLEVIVNQIQAGGYVTGISEKVEGGVVVGHILTFSDGKVITIMNGKDGKDGKNGADGKDGKNGADGKDGASPVIGIRQFDDGRWYWTLNGSWLLDSDGNKVRAEGRDGKDGADGKDGKNGQNGKDGADGKDGTDGKDGKDGSNGKDGVTPQLKIEDGYWYLSIDKGVSWSKLSKATGEKGDAFFRTVTPSETSVEFVLADGTTFSIPRSNSITITFDNEEGSKSPIGSYETIRVNYTLSYGDEKTVVTASSDGNFTVNVNKTSNTTGYLLITCPKLFVKGFVNVLVSDGIGYSTVSVINLYEKEVTFTEGMEYSVKADGGSISIPYTANIPFEISAGATSSWLTVDPAEAEKGSGTFTVKAQANPDFSGRKGEINIFTKNSSGEPFKTLIINQASAIFDIDRSSFLADSNGGQFVSHVSTTLGLTVEVPSDCNWITKKVDADQNGKDFTLTFDVAINNTGDKRFCDVALKSGDGTKTLGKISFAQLATGGNVRDMIFTVKVGYPNDYTTYLPIVGDPSLDCYIDWGDGKIEHIEKSQTGGSSDYVKHKYTGLSTTTTLDINVSGTVPLLNSYNIPENCLQTIIAVKQWGNCQMRSAYGAFKGQIKLKSVPGDTEMAFADVETIANMFSGCTSLESVHTDVFKYATKATSADNAFKLCSSLASITADLFKNTTNINSMSQCFSGSGIKSVPEKFFDSLTKLTNADQTFMGCASLESIPQGLFAKCNLLTQISNCFNGCSSLTVVPEKLFENCSKIQDFSNLFANCTSITSIPSDLLKYSPDASSVNGMFNECSKLSGVPTSLFDNNRRIMNFGNVFYKCNSASMPESPYTVIEGHKVHLYERASYSDDFITPTTTGGAFRNSSFSDLDSIPSNWK